MKRCFKLDTGHYKLKRNRPKSAGDIVKRSVHRRRDDALELGPFKSFVLATDDLKKSHFFFGIHGRVPTSLKKKFSGKNNYFFVGFAPLVEWDDETDKTPRAYSMNQLLLDSDFESNDDDE